jgi:phosphohistidine phosphatase
MTDKVRLILMRHAKADSSGSVQDDFLRPLTERGLRDARNMGRWLATHDLLPEQIISSPARRTCETLEKMSEGAGIDLGARTRFVPQLYTSTLDNLLAVLEAETPQSNLLVLGHNPGLEELLDYLSGDAHGANGFSKLFPTGAVFVLELSGGLDELLPRSATVKTHQRPKQIDG